VPDLVACVVPRGVLQVEVARGFLARARGLLLRPAPSADRALLIAPCASIHTFGMSYPIDVLFIDRAGSVLRVCTTVGTCRIRMCRGATAVLELRAGVAPALGLTQGLRLSALQPHLC
jgi:uncharacterized membrane protein (UPF0127 family)